MVSKLDSIKKLKIFLSIFFLHVLHQIEESLSFFNWYYSHHSDFGIFAILAYICRYNPEKWIPYVNENRNGEVTILEKFLQVSRRYIPNFILDLTENKQHIYSNNLTQPTDLRESIFSEELEEKIKKIMNKY